MMKYGGMFIFDEINMVDSDIISSLNDVLDGTKQKILDNGEIIHAHPLFRFAESMNIGYAGTNEMNLSHKSRIQNKIKISQLPIDKMSHIIVKETGIDDGERFFPIVDTEIKNIIEQELEQKVTNMYNLLFWDYDKNTFISDAEINSWLRRINNKYKICNGSLHNHRLRHDRITQWRENGISLEAIQYLAGHVEGSNITTDVYIDVSEEYAFSQYKKIN